MEFTSSATDDDTFRAAVQIEGKRKDMTGGLNLSGQLSSNQDNFGIGAARRGDFHAKDRSMGDP